MAAYRDVVVDDWEVLGYEPMGSKPDKLWLQPPASGPVDPDRRWLFKPATTQHERDREYRKGDDCAEKIAAGIAILLGVPAAPVELATRRGMPGILSGDVSGGRELVLGNEVLSGQDPDYDLHRRRGVPGYTVTAVFAALRHLGVEPPDVLTGRDVCDVFAGYLLLDALVANTDRHHENWGVLVDPAGEKPPQLAATFDHASSLGFQLSDEERVERLITRDRNRTVAAYANRGRSRHFAGAPSLVNLAVDALYVCGDGAREHSRELIGALTDEGVEDVVAAVPEPRMSQPARTFSVTLLNENRRRLLDELDRAR